ncbi:SnoaL-like domain-containing protein [Portibacter lacus]|nr:SnoaL-like domain-containing protein [Portibacter lacus]
MTTQEIANRLVEICRTGDYGKAIQELYSPSIVSVEPEGIPNRIVSGFDALEEKSKNFNAKIESINSSEISDPLVADNIFSVAMLMNVNMKGVPVPVDMNEICVYTVAEGKIVKEEFFFTPQPQG